MQHSRALLALVLAATAAAYWPAMSGPFLFDDIANLEPVRQWLTGTLTWQQLVFGNLSGPSGRPLAMLSFLVSGWLGGYTPFSFKLGNLLLHLANGLLVHALFRRMVTRDPVLGQVPIIAPLMLAGIWLLHPMLVSTVAYTVQRMAILSATFALLALLAYLQGRKALEAGRPQVGWLWLFGGVPALTLLGIMAKENAVLVPLLCAVLEWVYFAPKTGMRRPLQVRAFLLLGVALPLLGTTALLVVAPEIVIGGYENRPFTLVERLLTQPRVLFEYLGQLLLPWGPRLSLYSDDYVVSTALLSPIATLFALLGWTALLGVAWACRHTVPALLSGLGLYLVGHALESSFLPLLIYFEHRNYLPSIGVLWALAGVLVWLGGKLAPRMDRPKPVFGVASLLLVAVLAGATHARARVWQSREALLISSLTYHPDSRWLRMELAQLAMDQNPPNPAQARAHYRAMLATSSSDNQQIGRLGLAAVDCFVDGQTAETTAARLFEGSGLQIEADMLKAIESLGAIVVQRRCEHLTPLDYANALVSWLGRSPLPEATRNKWRLRYHAARLYSATDHNRAALTQATIAWNTGQAELPVGVLMIGLQIRMQDYLRAEVLLRELRPSLSEHDAAGKQLFDQYEEAVDAWRTHTSNPDQAMTQ